MNHKGTQTIETERLILRKCRPDDAQALFDNWASDDNVTKFMTWSAYKSVEEAHGRIAYLLGEYDDENFYEWFIELKEIGQPIGSIGAATALAANGGDRALCRRRLPLSSDFSSSRWA